MEDHNDSVIESLGKELLDYASKEATSDETWVKGSLAIDASAWSNETDRQKDALDLNDSHHAK